MRKPSPGIFTHALDMCGVAAGESIMVGDNFSLDLAPASRLGMHICWYTKGDLAQDDPRRPCVIREFSELAGILQKSGGFADLS